MAPTSTVNNLVLSNEPEAASRADTILGDYWRGKYEQLRNEATTQTIISLCSQLRTIKRLAQEDEEGAMARILSAAKVGLEVGRDR